MLLRVRRVCSIEDILYVLCVDSSIEQILYRSGDAVA